MEDRSYIAEECGFMVEEHAMTNSTPCGALTAQTSINPGLGRH